MIVRIVDILADCMFLLGFFAVVYGCWLVAIPLAFVVAGVCLIAISLRIGRPPDASN